MKLQAVTQFPDCLIVAARKNEKSPYIAMNQDSAVRKQGRRVPTARCGHITSCAIVFVGDIVAVNGKPAKCLWTARSTVFSFEPNAVPGHSIADLTRGNVIDMHWEILQNDGTPIGTLAASGLTRGSPPPGAPVAQTGDNLTIVGGTGAFLGVRGQAGVIDLGSPRQASAVEDPASRRTIGGAKRSYVLHLLPLSTPEILMLPSGPAVVHASDGSLVTAAKPAQAGEILSLYASGVGPTLPGVDPGQPFTTDPLQRVSSPVDITVGGTAAIFFMPAGTPVQLTHIR